MTWKTIRRETGLIEHVCSLHGTGHPNAGSIQYMAYAMDGKLWEESFEAGESYPTIPEEPIKSSWGVHGCCGCCADEDFPGKAVGAIRFAIDKMKAERPEMIDDLKKDYYLLWWGILAALQEADRLQEEH